MISETRWRIQDSNISLEKNAAGLEAFGAIFDHVLAAPNLHITSATSMPTETAGIIAIRGTANTWQYSTTQVAITYRQDTDQILSLQLSKAISGYPGLDLPEILKDKLSFDALQLMLLAKVPNDGNASLSQISYEIVGQLHIGAKPVTIHIQHPSPSRRFFIDTELQAGVGFADLVHLFGNADHPNQDLAELPQDIWQATDIITLNDLRLEIDPQDSDLLTYLSVTLLFAEGKQWAITNELAVGGLWVQINVDYPLGDARFPILKLGGEMEIAGGKLEITARWPDWAIHGKLQRGTVIHVGQLFSHFGLIPAGQAAATHDLTAGFSDLVIRQLFFSAEPFGTPKQFTVHLSLTDVWSIPLAGQERLAIEELSLLMNYQGDTAAPAQPTALKGNSGIFDVTFMGKVQVAAVRLFLIAQYQGSGWQFEGGIQPDSELKLGELFADIARKFGVDGIPYSISHLVLENLRLSFNTATQDFTFTCAGQLPIHDNKTIDARVTIQLTHQGEGSYTRDIDGYLAIDAYVFDLHLEQTQHSHLLAASYRHQGESEPLHVKQLLMAVADSDFIKHDIPDLEIDLQDILFAFATSDAAAASGNGAASSQTASKFLFGLDLGAEISLADLPLVGKEFPADQTPGIESLKILYATASFTSSEVAAINRLLPDGVKTLPAAASGGRAPETALPQGFNFGAILKLGIETTAFSLPALAPNQASSNQGATPDAPANRATDDATWITIQKTLGPVDFEKIGARYQAGKLWFLLSAALSAADLTIALDGLGAGVALKPFAREFSLRGLGIDYRSDSLEIGGAFLRQRVQAEPEPYDEYDGMVVIKTEELSLAALGAYSKYQGHDSLFIYAVLDYPLGGPSFFFVTGLAAGFGYNRDLKVPPIEQVAQFPLVAEALSPQAVQGANASVAAPGAAGDQATGAATIRSIADTLTAELEKLRQFVPPAPVDFLAVGLRFTSFKIVDSFALLTLAFGHRFELHVLGLSTLISPAPEEGQDVTPLAEAQLALKASFIPDEGFLGVQAQLTNSSYILSRACFLTGGFAFFAWYKDNPRHDPAGYQSGDFVLTIGGYHPRFVVPQYYPKVPRLGFNWRVNDQIGIKGDLYFALTGHAMMAGGHLDAVWESGDLKAWFKAGADFIVSWKPYYYDASMYVDIGASLTFDFFGTHHITIELGADMHLWGPEFSGKATLHYWVISCTIAFGADAQTPKPLDWAAFKSLFLPAEDAITSIAVKSGLVTKDEQDATCLGVMNPKEFLLITNSFIPISETNVSADTAAVRKAFGVAPMAVTRDDISASKHTVSITRDGQDATRDFQFAPVTKNVPAGLWGESFAPDLNSQAMVADTWAGLEIRPQNPPLAGETAPIDRRQLQFETETLAGAYVWETPPDFVDDGGDEAYRRTVIRQTISDAATQARRDGLLQALGMAACQTPNADLIEALLFAPRLEAPQA